MNQVHDDMANPPTAHGPKPEACVLPIANFWLTLFETANGPGKTILDWWAPFWDPRLLQKKWLATWGQAMDEYLRSTAFLELMHQCTTSLAPRDSNGNAAEPRQEIIEGDSHR